MDFSKLLKETVDKQASDLHIKVGSPPILRIDTKLVTLKGPKLEAKDIEGFIKEILEDKRYERFQMLREMDVAYVAPDIGRFRVDMFYQRDLPGMVLRRVKKEFKNFAELGLPDTVKNICNYERGIVLVCGPARSGKSTTISTMINHINNTKRIHIVTVEDPIEYQYDDNKSIINQREIGVDTQSFSSALKHIMRQDPDLVFFGELRDQDGFQTVINVAETGHLVFTTLHAHSAIQAVDRSLEYFSVDMRDQIRMQIANNLIAIVALRLLPKKDDSGVVPAVEVLIANSIVRKLIRENKLNKLQAAMELGTGEGMQTFNQSLLKLIQSGAVTEQDAFSISPNPESLKLNLQGIFLDDAKKILED